MSAGLNLLSSGKKHNCTLPNVNLQIMSKRIYTNSLLQDFSGKLSVCLFAVTSMRFLIIWILYRAYSPTFRFYVNNFRDASEFRYQKSTMFSIYSVICGEVTFTCSPFERTYENMKPIILGA